MIEGEGSLPTRGILTDAVTSLDSYMEHFLRCFIVLFKESDDP